MNSAGACEIYIDGASHGNPGPAGIGVVFLNGSAEPVKELSRYIGETTNNVAEYMALVYALQEAVRAGYHAVTVKTDSELLARQMSGRYQVRDAQLRLLYGIIQHVGEAFQEWQVVHVPRAQNAAADRLATQGANRKSG